MIKKVDSNKARAARHRRVRAKISGTPERPRLNVFRSSKHIYAQLIDDKNHRTLAAASSLEREAPLGKARLNCAAAEWVGKTIAERGVKAGVERVVFDRGSFRFHGRIKSLAEAARSGGLSF